MRFRLPVVRSVLGAGVGAAGVGALVAAATGRLALDLGIGRQRRPLGPLAVTIRAPRDVVYAVVVEPYLGRPTRALSAKLRVVDRGTDMVVAEHHTRVRPWLIATTLEVVRFTPPVRVDFRLLRGPVPAVTESFELEEIADGTELRYEGLLETDLWRVGAAWGRLVAGHWTTAVSQSLEAIGSEAERRAARAKQRDVPV